MKRQKSHFKTLSQALYVYYTSPQLPVFRQLRNGAIYFSVGLIFIYLANISMAPSLSQELVVGLSILLSLVGFMIAMTAYMRLVISRIVVFFSRK